MQIKRLFDIPYYQRANYPQKKAIGNKEGQKWTYYSTVDLIEDVNAVSRGLLNLGVKKGDKIALISYNNRREWNVMDLGIQQIGAVGVPVYPTISPKEYAYIFNDAGVKLCFVGCQDLLEKVKETKNKVKSLKDIYTFNNVRGAKHWKSIFTDEGQEEVEDLKESIESSELATIIYTSGTTGNPKGVMLSHNNIASNVRAVLPLLPVGAKDQALSFLPLCHIFERTVSYAYMAKGVTITYAESVEKLGDNLKEMKPHFFTTVPRLLEKVYEKIYNSGLALTGYKKKLFFWALDMTENYEYDQALTGMNRLKWKVADKLIFSKWREALGGNVKGIVTGAAACPLKMARVFSAAGIPIREGYGLTETSLALTIGRFSPNGGMLGTVGPELEGVTLKIDSSDGEYKEGEGEILAKGPNVMMGYYNKPDKTAEVIDADGWFHTGDIGKFLNGGNGMRFLKITDRKKELLKTSGGKYVAPAPIESKFKGDFLIEQMMVVGEKQKFVSAIIVPAEVALKDWCSKNDVAWTSFAKAIESPKVIEHFQEILDAGNVEFSKTEKVKRFRLVSDTWDVTSGELTPTMKLKRRVILEKYRDLIADIYNV